MLFEDFLALFPQSPRKKIGGGWNVICPAHTDKDPSLSVTLKESTILIKCQAGCKTEDVVKLKGLTLADLFTGKQEGDKQAEKTISDTYDYKDEGGNFLYQVVRYVPKSFSQRHKNGSGEWVWDMQDVRRVLYHLPEIMTELGTIYLVEGEKDADALWAWGQIATTSPGGANAWHDEYAECLTGKKVVIIPDKDSAGFAYARQVANSLIGKVSELRVIILPGDALKDISDWLSAGGDVETLPSLEQDIETLFASDKPVYRQLDDAIQWDKKVGPLLLTFRAEKISEERTGVHARVAIFGQHESLSWSYLNIERREDRSSLAGAAHSALKTDAAYSKDDIKRDLDNFCAGLWEFHLSRFVPIEMEGDETPQPLSFYLKPFIIEGGGTILFAPPGRGKSYVAKLVAVSIDAGCQKFWATQQKRVLFINLERSGESIRRRLSMVNKVLGLPAKRPLLTLNARGRSLLEVLPACRKSVKKHNVGMVVLDSISRAGLGDLNENQPGNRIIDALSSLCPTWLALGHTSRASEEHMYGTIMQDAGADICIQLLSQVKDNGMLGIGLQITKRNDIGDYGQKIYAAEFNENGLVDFRLAKSFEFPEIEGKNLPDMLTAIIEWVTNQDSGDATATEIAKEFGYTRANVSRLFTQSGKFIQTRKVRHSVYYGVKTLSVHP